MSRRPARFTETDIRKAVKAAAGKMAVEMLPSGVIRLVPVADLTSAEYADELDRELTEFRSREGGT